jgi:hypothetical protein
VVQPASLSPASSPLDDDEAPPLDEPDETLPPDEPDEPLPLDEPPLDEAVPPDVDEPSLDEPSSVTPPESAAAAAPPSSPGKSPMPRSEPHPATGHSPSPSAISHATLVRRHDRERRAWVTTSPSPGTGVEEFVRPMQGVVALPPSIGACRAP